MARGLTLNVRACRRLRITARATNDALCNDARLLTALVETLIRSGNGLLTTGLLLRLFQLDRLRVFDARRTLGANDRALNDLLNCEA